LTEAKTYDQVIASFKEVIPKQFNIGVAVCDRHVAAGFGDDDAIIYAHADGTDTRYTFRDMMRLSNKLSNALRASCGVVVGDRIAIYLPQSPETAITHVSAYKLGAISLPLFALFGPEAVSFRLTNSGSKVVVTDQAGVEIIRPLVEAGQLPHLQHVIVTGKAAGAFTVNGVFFRDFEALLAPAASDFSPVNTSAEDPALIIYTSGTTGTPKGCLHAHRVLLGHLPGVEMPQNFFPKAGDLFWTPADWAWIGGLLDVLLPSLYHRVPVLAHRAKKFDPDETFHLMRKYQVKNVFMPPTALKMIRKSCKQTYNLRSLGSGGETLGAELLDWGRATFGVEINEFYGQTENNLVLSNCAPCFPIRPGSMGKPVPGKTVAVLDPDGVPLPRGSATIGNIAVKRPDSSMFLRYWNLPEATAAKFQGEWLLTGDQGKVDKDGYFWFVGRDDDIICSAGYRIGPSEIEDCLIKHPKVALAAAVGKPDPTRTEIVKAFVVLREGTADQLSDGERKSLSQDIQQFVKVRLAAHEYPREVEFVNELPMTTTGKVIRKTLKQLEIDRAKK